MLDIGMYRLDHNQKLELKEVLTTMRSQRLHSVQTDVQYVFVYKALIDYIVKKHACKFPADEKGKFEADYTAIMPK